MDLKACRVILSNSELAESAAQGLKAGLSRWKANIRASQPTSESSLTGDSSDPELEPVNLISDNASHIGRNQKPSNISLNSLFAEYKERKPKVEIVVEDEVAGAAEVETEEFKNRMKLENEQGQGKILRIPPGIEWLRRCSSTELLTSLPIEGSDTLCEADREVITLLRCPSKTLHMAINFLMFIQLVKNKRAVLDNMFIAMCLHSRSSTKEVLRKELYSLLAHDYQLVDAELHSWFPSLSLTLTSLKHLGAASTYSECLTDTARCVATENNETTRQRCQSVKALLSVLARSAKSRKPYLAEEILQLILVIAKLSLDKTLLCQSLTSDFGNCLHALIASVTENSSVVNFSSMEQELCREILSIAKHHHNKLHLIKIIPSLSERATNLKMTLAYLAICQLLDEEHDISDGDALKWSMNSLAHKYFSLEIDDSTDMYLLHSLITLFDIAIGSHIDLKEKEDLDAMRELLAKQCHTLRENPMKPDITTTKYYMHRVILRWNWVSQQASSIEELLDIEYKPTPTKIIPVDSQEVRTGPSDDEENSEENMSWSQAVSSQTSLLDTKVDEKFSKSAKEAIDLPSQDRDGEVKDKGSLSQNLHITKLFSATPTINPAGLERLRNAVRDACGVSPTSSRPNTPDTKALQPTISSQSCHVASNFTLASCSETSQQVGATTPHNDTHILPSTSGLPRGGKSPASQISENDTEDSLPDLD